MLFILDALSRWINAWAAGPVDTFLGWFNVQSADPTRPITNALTLEIVSFLLLVCFFILVRFSLSVEKPGAIQLVAERVYDFVDEQGESIIGQDRRKHMPLAACILMFILVCNLFGILPGLGTPTSSPVVPLAIALVTFVYYNFLGFKVNGPIGYTKHFMGPVWWMAPFMFPLEIISHLARILSLTARLYANMFASDLLTLVFFSMIPIGIPIIFLALHFGVALIQAYVFMLLMMIYVSGATAHDEESTAM